MEKSLKIKLLKAMDKVVRLYDADEDLIFWWLQDGLPDFASEEDYKLIASSAESFNETVELFVEIVNQFE